MLVMKLTLRQKQAFYSRNIQRINGGSNTAVRNYQKYDKNDNCDAYVYCWSKQNAVFFLFCYKSNKLLEERLLTY